jgi:hypothetical protein
MGLFIEVVLHFVELELLSFTKLIYIIKNTLLLSLSSAILARILARSSLSRFFSFSRSYNVKQTQGKKKKNPLSSF